MSHVISALRCLRLAQIGQVRPSATEQKTQLDDTATGTSKTSKRDECASSVVKPCVSHRLLLPDPLLFGPK
jgi:hypothetical protein